MWPGEDRGKQEEGACKTYYSLGPLLGLLTARLGLSSLLNGEEGSSHRATGH